MTIKKNSWLHDFHDKEHTPAERLAATVLLLTIKEASGTVEYSACMAKSTVEAVIRDAKKWFASRQCLSYCRMLSRVLDQEYGTTPEDMQAALIARYRNAS